MRMISVHEALTQILETVSPLAGERISLFEATGRVLAEGVESVRKVPPFTNSAMDGYAVRHDDIQSAQADQPVALSVLEVIQAGAVPTKTVEPRTASKIMTGAVLPPGADTVIKVEDTQEQAGQVLIRKAGPQGNNVRGSGEDIQPGQTILKPGRVLRPAEARKSVVEGKSGARGGGRIS